MTERARIFCAVSGIIGVLMLVISFNINPGPPPGAGYEKLLAFGLQYYNSILWGAWLQTIGPFLIILFAFSLVFASRCGANNCGVDGFFWSRCTHDDQSD